MLYPLGLTGTLYPLGLHPGIALLIVQCIPCVHLDNLAPTLDLLAQHPSLSLASTIPSLDLTTLAQP